MTTKVKALFGGISLAAVMALSAQPASAAIIVTTGFDGGSGDVDNVVFNSCTGNIAGPATHIQGCLNTQPTTLINFFSDEDIFSPAGGQARIEASDGGYSLLTISAVDATFAKLQLNINASQNGFVTFSGLPGGDSLQFAIGSSGNNQFTITGENFLSLTLNTTVDIVADVRQIRLGGLQEPGGGDEVPEPTLLALFGLGLLGAGAARRRAKK